MEQAAQPGAQRPTLVWAVFLDYLVSVVYTALTFSLIYSGSISLTPEQTRYFYNLSAFDYVITAVSGVLNLAGAVAIFRLRKIAFHLFTAALAVAILQSLAHAMTTNFLAALGGPGAVGVLVGHGLSAAVCVYAWRLKARGVLI